MNKGLQDWWMQRLSAGLISIFALPLLGLWYTGYLPDAQSWYGFLSTLWGRLITFVGLLGFAIHARIGLWVVITDYVPRSFQQIAQGLMYVWVLGLLVYGSYLIWIL